MHSITFDSFIVPLFMLLVYLVLENQEEIIPSSILNFQLLSITMFCFSFILNINQKCFKDSNLRENKVPANLNYLTINVSLLSLLRLKIMYHNSTIISVCVLIQDIWLFISLFVLYSSIISTTLRRLLFL